MAEVTSKAPVDVERPRTRRSGGCFSFLIAFVVVGLVGLMGISFVVAATGLVRIPLMSSLAFRAIEPVRVVEASSEDLSLWFTGALRQESLRQARLGTLNRNVAFTIPEAILTGVVRSVGSTVDVSDVPIDFSRVQVAVVEESLEVFLPLKETETAVLVRVEPQLVDETVSWDIQSVRVGRIRIPQSVVDRLLKNSVEIGTSDLVESLGGVMQVRGISVSEEGLKIEGELVPGIL